MSMKERVAAALAESGWVVKIVGSEDEPRVPLLPSPGGVPMSECWRAFAVAGYDPPCWACWRDDEDCTHDWRVEPWPPVVRPGDPLPTWDA